MRKIIINLNLYLVFIWIGVRTAQNWLTIQIKLKYLAPQRYFRETKDLSVEFKDVIKGCLVRLAIAIFKSITLSILFK